MSKPLRYLIVFITMILIYVPIPGSSNESPKIALLFLTRKDFNHPHLWKELLESSEYKDRFTIYIHSKEPLLDPYFKNFRIKNIVPTTWSRHVLAWPALLQEALRDHDNVKFVFLSEACIPLHSLDEIYKKLISDDQTTMYFARPWWGEILECTENTPLGRDVLRLPKKHRWANTEWVILNRKHADFLTKEHTITSIISLYDHNHESWPSSLLSCYNLLDEVNPKLTTYVNWSFPAEDGYFPRQFYIDTQYNYELLCKAKKDGFLFARKILKEFPEERLKEVVDLDISNIQ